MRRSARPIADYAGLDDPVIDVSITPNRQDCMGVRGIARDLAAAGLGTLKPLAEVYRMAALEPIAGDGPGARRAHRRSRGLPGLLRAGGVAASPTARRPTGCSAGCKAIGQKPISALVDITNFVMIDLGRPLHVYDRAKLSGGAGRAQGEGRRAGAGAQRQDLHARRDA